MSVFTRKFLLIPLLAMGLLCGCLNHNQTSVYNALKVDRHAHGLRMLPTQADAQRHAQAWAEKLARDNKLSHSDLRASIKTGYCSLGENVGYGSSVEVIEAAYMASPDHRANILNTKWNGVGVGHATNGTRVFTVQVFIKTC